MTSYRLVSVIHVTPEAVAVNELPIPYDFEVGSLQNVLVVRVPDNMTLDAINELSQMFACLVAKNIIKGHVLVVPYGTDFLGIEELDR